jgi:dTDP-4-dehydrorhamnose reductase
MTHVLIFGAQGQIGSALSSLAQQCGVPCRAMGRAECDINDPVSLGEAIRSSRFAVNCAAYTAVDQAEAEAKAAHHVNTTGAENVAAACAGAGIPLVHLSTDYVFDGASARPIREDDPTGPISVYGQSKLGVEMAVRNCLKSHIILRTSWVFSAHGPNFVKTILRLARAQDELRIIDDQLGGPTAADDIAQAILHIIAAASKPGFGDWGTYHLSGAPPVSWYEFARAIVAQGGTKVLPIATRDYPRPARRPLNSVLDCSRIAQVFGIRQPDWRPALRKVLEELAADHGARLL